MLINALLFTQVFCMCAAVFFWFYKSGNTFAESGSLSIICVFMLLSFIRQISFITGYSIISTCIEAFFLITSFILIFRYRSYIVNILDTLKRFRSENPISFIFLVLCFLYLAIHAFLPVPKEFQNTFYNVPDYQKSGFFSLGAVSEFSKFLPINHFILFNTFLGFETDSNAGLFCFLSYLSIGFSTYALARRYSWPTIAFTTAILVMSIPRLVVQAISPDPEIISIAVALFCILAIYRSVEQPTLLDLILLILGIFFCISEDISSMIFAPILFFLSCVVLFRRHGMITWKSILGKNLYAVFAVLPAAIFSQCRLFLSPYFDKTPWSGPFSSISFNNDGIQGALANFIRYIFESAYFTAPVDIFFEKIFKWSTAQTLESLYNFSVKPFSGENGAAQVFHLTWMPNEMFSFGPVGFFLILPALCYALLKAPRRLKSVAVALLVYFYLVCLIIAWEPGNATFLGIFYVCAGFSMAFFFPPWRFTKRINKIVQAIGCLLLFFMLLAAS